MLNLKKSKLGNELLNLAKRIFPLNRSLTGDGNRQTLQILKEYISNLKIYEVESGTTAGSKISIDTNSCRTVYLENNS